MSRNKISQENFEMATGKLVEASEEWKRNPGDFVRDALIQRFEFTYETAWKALKRYLEELGIPDRNSPREVIKEAYTQKLIVDETLWLQMIRDRNLTSHLYQEQLAREIAERITNLYEPVFQHLISTLQNMNK